MKMDQQTKRVQAFPPTRPITDLKEGLKPVQNPLKMTQTAAAPVAAL